MYFKRCTILFGVDINQNVPGLGVGEQVQYVTVLSLLHILLYGVFSYFFREESVVASTVKLFNMKIIVHEFSNNADGTILCNLYWQGHPLQHQQKTVINIFLIICLDGDFLCCF